MYIMAYVETFCVVSVSAGNCHVLALVLLPARMEIQSLYCSDNLGPAMQNVPSDICGEQRPRSACTSAQSDQCLYCRLLESFDVTECMDGEQRPG